VQKRCGNGAVKVRKVDSGRLPR